VWESARGRNLPAPASAVQWQWSPARSRRLALPGEARYRRVPSSRDLRGMSAPRLGDTEAMSSSAWPSAIGARQRSASTSARGRSTSRSAAASASWTSLNAWRRGNPGRSRLRASRSALATAYGEPSRPPRGRRRRVRGRSRALGKADRLGRGLDLGREPVVERELELGPVAGVAEPQKCALVVGDAEVRPMIRALQRHVDLESEARSGAELVHHQAARTRAVPCRRRRGAYVGPRLFSRVAREPGVQHLPHRRPSRRRRAVRRTELRLTRRAGVDTAAE
jgi:hypothetical protein